MRCLQSWASVDTHKQIQARGRKLGGLGAISSAEMNQSTASFPVFITHLDEKVVIFHTVTEQSPDYRFPGYVAVSCTPDSSITFLTVFKFLFSSGIVEEC